MTIVHGNARMDADTKLMVEVTPQMLKTIQACAVVRQARMLEIERTTNQEQMWEFVDASRVEADKSYSIGVWAEHHLNSLIPERIEEEWFLGRDGRLYRWKEFGEGEAEAIAVPAGY